MAYAIFEQDTGVLRICDFEDGGVDRVLYEHHGYSGRGECRNNPACENRRGYGPIPRGFYTLALRAHPRFRGPAFFLHPAATNRMHGRSGFWIHGDSMVDPGNASSGCIVLDHSARSWLEHFQVRKLEVVPPDGGSAADLNTP